MSRLKRITDEGASDRARPLLDAPQNRLGLVPNRTRAMANFSAVLEGSLQLSIALGVGKLPEGPRAALPRRRPVQRVRSLPGGALVHRQDGGADRRAGPRQPAGWGGGPAGRYAAPFALEVLKTRGKVSATTLAALRSAGVE